MIQQVPGLLRWYKLYLVVFTVEGKKVYKIGITSHSDVRRRFQHLLDSEIITDFKIWISVWIVGKLAAEQKEQECFSLIKETFPQNNYIKEGTQYFHNVWLENKISGVTEIRKYNPDETEKAYNFIENSGSRYKANV